ncbi:hypothetical protein [Entomomonas asaccharolytica]|uniref:Uncharacterized protein n=1 Tax=Entomomonas asaccharolytica TaxID=2785331 RepID=A0A974NEN8_9GAMM|nr:hypothetical protein [Entomomonas asaccharolytica]QQP85391.1 hypothetical protein JHT90_13585 [Entomomonas asaccharolytica]
MVSSYHRLLLALLMMLVSSVSFALSCVAPPTLAEYFNKADAVFVVKVDSVTNEGLQAEFMVEQIYKGVVPELNKMIIKPMPYWFDKVFFKKQQHYLAFYQKDEDLFWGACSRNIILLNKNNRDKLDKIMSLYKEAMELEKDLSL